MFSWYSARGASTPPPPSEPQPVDAKKPELYDPLKGGRGATRFYSEDYELPSKTLGKLKGSAAQFYENATSNLSASSGVAELNSFLKEGRAKLVNQESESGFRVVLGNEAADLDSFASALAYSYFLKSTSDSSVVDIPVIAITRDQLHLRTDVAWLLQDIELDIQSLIFIDEINMEALLEQNKLQLVLVDHNVLSTSLEKLGKAVIEIVDHHAPEDRYPWVTKKSIHQVGSCSTLVAEIISEANAELLKNVTLCRLLLGAILSDTADLDQSSKRSDPRDEIMAALLVLGSGSTGRSGYAQQLIEKKFDVMGLSTLDLLRSDYKQWTFGPGSTGKKGEKIRVGFSSVGLSLAHLVGKDEAFVVNLNQFIYSKAVHVLVIMCFYPQAAGSKRIKRELALCSSIDAVIPRLSAWVQSADNGLKLKPITVKGFPTRMKAFSQGNSAASRKVLQPLVAQYFNQSQ